MQFMPLFPSLFSLFPNSADIFFIYTVIFTLSKPAGGVLFGVAFWIVVRSFSPDNIVRDYMIISAFGLILLFVSKKSKPVGSGYCSLSTIWTCNYIISRFIILFDIGRCVCLGHLCLWRYRVT